MKSVIVRAPCSTANLGPGFDVFGLALDAFYDQVELTKKIGKGIIIIKSDDIIPLQPEKNSAGLVVKEMVKKFKINSGLEVRIKKGVPAGYGMGSSAASAAAAAVAVNSLFDLGLDQNELVEYAGVGERASAGSIHYDNVGASVCGGFVIVRTNPLTVIRVNPPKDLVLCIAIPKIEVPKKKTEVSRGVLPKQVLFTDHVKNLSNASAITAGFILNDVNMIGNSIKDIIVEPARQHLIPSFDNVRKLALRAGALGFTISGAGPSVIAFTSKNADHTKICKAMEKGFAKSKIKCTTLVCKPSKGAFVV